MNTRIWVSAAVFLLGLVVGVYFWPSPPSAPVLVARVVSPPAEPVPVPVPATPPAPVPAVTPAVVAEEPPPPAEPFDFARDTIYWEYYRFAWVRLMGGDMGGMGPRGAPDDAKAWQPWFENAFVALMGQEILSAVFDPVQYGLVKLGSVRALRAAQRDLEAAGRPQEMAEILPPPLAVADNAAPVYLDVATRLGVKDAAGMSVLDKVGKINIESPTPEEIASLRKLLAEPVVAQAIGELEAATLKSCRFDLDYSKGFALLLPHLSPMRRLMYLLVTKAKVQADAGDLAGAWDTELCALRFADALKTEPMLISQLVRAAVTRRVLETLPALAQKSLPSDAQQKSLEAALKSLADPGVSVRAFDFERVMAEESLFNRPSSLPIEVPWATGYVLDFNPLYDRDHAAYLKVMGRYAAIAEQPYSREAAEEMQQVQAGVPDSCMAAKLLVPALSQVWKKFAEQEARVEVVRAGLAVQRWRQEHGAWPASLAEAGVATTDPFGRQPLRYRVSEAGFVLYSLGGNFVDDNGAGQPENGGQPLDIVWETKGP